MDHATYQVINGGLDEAITPDVRVKVCWFPFYIGFSISLWLVWVWDIRMARAQNKSHEYDEDKKRQVVSEGQEWSAIYRPMDTERLHTTQFILPTPWMIILPKKASFMVSCDDYIACQRLVYLFLYLFYNLISTQTPTHTHTHTNTSPRHQLE